ncbi:MAG TPA: alkaline phosphatase family protein, partial [Candidatus Tumulicola sp.]
MFSFFARVGTILALVGAAACSGGDGSFGAPQVKANRSNVVPHTISHVVIVVQENRSFDNLFATFPGADGATSGYFLKKSHGA